MKMMLLLLSTMVLMASPATIKPTMKHRCNLQEISSLLPSVAPPKLPYTENMLPLGTGQNKCQDLFFCKSEQILTQVNQTKLDETTRNLTVRVARNLAVFNKSQFKCNEVLPKFSSTGEKMEFSKFMDVLLDCCDYRLIKGDFKST